uniref:Uncharacterized protein n=1 Tax=Setaria italica TaxID=4555 RepID=K3ZGM3_SETIT
MIKIRSFRSRTKTFLLFVCISESGVKCSVKLR